MTKFLVGLEKFLHSLTHSFCRHIVKTFTFLYLFLKQQKVLHLFCRHTTRRSKDSFAPPFFCRKTPRPIRKSRGDLRIGWGYFMPERPCCESTFGPLLRQLCKTQDGGGDQPHHSEDAEHSLPRDEQRDLKICHSAFLLNP